MYGAFLLLPSHKAALVILDISQLSSSRIFKRGRASERAEKKKTKQRKKLNFIRERNEEEDIVKQRRRNCVWLLARGGKKNAKK